eukprot:TRINITY_DN11606_c0_g1_i1.p1 TRINITY_DN11606_c0_g1~~TRINITY_DN11606_c0_g1_i1.p1  ORF type:complete len:244 (-),score=33.01 TRINITY_DN11606_c0_g1_i1:81-812(-)
MDTLQHHYGPKGQNQLQGQSNQEQLNEYTTHSHPRHDSTHHLPHHSHSHHHHHDHHHHGHDHHEDPKARALAHRQAAGRHDRQAIVDDLRAREVAFADLAHTLEGKIGKQEEHLRSLEDPMNPLSLQLDERQSIMHHSGDGYREVDNKHIGRILETRGAADYQRSLDGYNDHNEGVNLSPVRSSHAPHDPLVRGLQHPHPAAAAGRHHPHHVPRRDLAVPPEDTLPEPTDINVAADMDNVDPY